MTDDTIDHPEPISYASMLPKSMVELMDLHTSLGGRPVLQGLSLSIREGECMAILGLSGTGKSVTLKHIIGLMRPDSGVVRINGKEITNGDARSVEEARERTGYLFQNAALLASMNVYENVALPLREHEELAEDEVRRRVRKALDDVGLDDVEEKMPAHLSGGMRKRVGLARALIRNPQILLYDEPTAGPDPPAARTDGAMAKEKRA